MGKISIKQKNNEWKLVNKCVYPEVMNEREFNLINRSMAEYLIPLDVQQKKKSIIFKSTIAGMIPLRTYFEGIVTKNMFLDVIFQIVTIIKICESNLMNINNLYLDCRYIFINPRTKKVKCLFWPIVNNQHPFYPDHFFQNIPYQVVFSRFEELDYIKLYIDYFKDEIPFSINSFEKLILQLLGETNRNENRCSLNHSREKDDKVTYKKGGNQIEYNPLKTESPLSTKKDSICPKCGNHILKSSKYCQTCGSVLFDYESSKSNQPVDSRKNDSITHFTDDFSETTILGEEYEATTILGEEEHEPIFPYLIREKTKEKIIIDKPSFRIGKEKSCDYFIFDNNAISRSHADIVTKNGRYYIIDQNSTNKTFVDGQVIPIHTEIEIFSGTKIKLANEEFTFYI